MISGIWIVNYLLPLGVTFNKFSSIWAMTRKMVFRLSVSFVNATSSVQSVWFCLASSRSSMVREIRRVKCNARFHFVGLSSSNRSSISGHGISSASRQSCVTLTIILICFWMFYADMICISKFCDAFCLHFVCCSSCVDMFLRLTRYPLQIVWYLGHLLYRYVSLSMSTSILFMSSSSHLLLHVYIRVIADIKLLTAHRKDIVKRKVIQVSHLLRFVFNAQSIAGIVQQCNIHSCS